MTRLATRGWLLDASALGVASRPSVTGLLGDLLRAGLLYTCPVLELQVLAVARSAADHARLSADRRLAYRSVPLTAAIGDRACELHAVLARHGHPDAAGPLHLLVAATALEHDLAVLHHGPAFALLAQLTGLSATAVAPLDGRT